MWFKLFVRSQIRNLNTFLITVLSLTVGISLLMVIGLYIHNELNYDKFHANKDNIYRLIRNNPSQYLESNLMAITPAPLKNEVLANVDEVEAMARFTINRNLLIQHGENSFFESEYQVADPSLFNIFSFPFLYGSVENFSQPYSALITRSMALKFFGKENAIGEEISIQAYKPLQNYTIRGVIDDVEQNSHLRLSLVFSFEDFIKEYQTGDLQNWHNHNYISYLQLNEHSANLPAIANNITDIFNKNAGFEASEKTSTYELQALKDIHTTPGISFDIQEAVPMSKLYILAFIAFLILIISCFNAINLSNAFIMTRAKEIGIRKINGASKALLTRLLMAEYFVLTFIPVAISAFLLFTFIPQFNSFFNVNIIVHPLKNPFPYILLIGIWVLISFVIGLYPVLLSNSLRPRDIMKGSFKYSKKGKTIREVSVFAQFVIAGSLIITALGIQNQTNYLLNKDIGFNKDNILVIPLRDRQIISEIKTLKQQLAQVPGIQHVSASSHLPNSITSSQGRKWELNGEEQQVSLYAANVDADFFDVYGLGLKEGRNFKENLQLDRQSYILNETAIKELDLDLSQRNRFIQNEDTIEVIGVVKDFNLFSLHQSIKPMKLMAESESWYNFLSIKVDSEISPAIIQSCRQVFGNMSSFPFDYYVYEQRIESIYQSEQKLASFVALTVYLAIFVCMIGLIGILLLSYRFRLKEIGIRKTLGASLLNLFQTFSYRFNIIVILSILISIPVAYFFLQRWLENFAYQSNLQAWYYVLPALLLFGMAWLVIGYFVIQSNRINPTEILRSE